MTVHTIADDTHAFWTISIHTSSFPLELFILLSYLLFVVVPIMCHIIRFPSPFLRLPSISPQLM